MSNLDLTTRSLTTLAIDTSTASLTVAIVRDGRLVDTSLTFAERNHSVRIISEIKELLARNGIRGNEIDLIAVGQGPGSYTGVRIAVTAAKTLAWTWNKPLIGVSSLEALAFGACKALKPEGKAWIVPIMDARRGQVYSSRFEAISNSHGDTHWQMLDPDRIRMIADWAPELGELSMSRSDHVQEQKNDGLNEADICTVWFVGDIGVHTATIEQVRETYPQLEIYSCNLDAGAIGQLGERRFRLGERDEVHTFVPNYTQLTEAESKLLSASRGE
ncbi:MAG: tRNA (adenosine(37)-N6)-threonylcarbamoyltransferase complex dimerization subunit type 1 TsaB [Candidatus Cohnella colombiensis]|uniref:tRNA (Adenosine(37)-N6)-threonylcarbamoyltransferase complex dimerization subunit type 1 TsaB n=1 Tax=Candidatus Cohnella colombiensis TaxID=3121368 RepID=A0AA95EZL9_9BACL|nr:MAG: tRNA (adenosine(37)-N6)-threonylcarbamoyltransferase complex dimerization subunit type 1 TsaB [Cohnella sp.]